MTILLRILRYSVTKYAATLVIGILIGCVIYRLPQFACGPLRWDLLALWVAAFGGLAAAVATYYAATVALRCSRYASVLELNERKRRTRVIATAFLSHMLNVAINVEAWALMIEDKRFTLKVIMQSIEPFAMQPLEAFVSKLELFDGSEARLVGRVYGLMADLVDQVRMNMSNAALWDEQFTAKQRVLYSKQIEAVRKYATPTYHALNIFSDENRDDNPAELGRAFYGDCVTLLTGH